MTNPNAESTLKTGDLVIVELTEPHDGRLTYEGVVTGVDTDCEEVPQAELRAEIDTGRRAESLTYTQKRVGGEVWCEATVNSREGDGKRLGVDSLDVV